MIPQPRIALVCGPGTVEDNGIVAFTARLTAALNATGDVDAVVLRLRAHEWRPWQEFRDRNSIPLGYDTYLLQYGPFSFARWGFAPWLPLAWQRLRKHAQARMVLTVHEAYALQPLRGWRDTAIGLGHRVQLRALLRATDVAITTCRERTDQLGSFAHRGAVHQVPVGSNLDEPAVPTDAEVLRTRLRGPHGRAIIATFGNAHPSRLMLNVELAVKALAETIGEHLVLNLGAHPPRITVPESVEVVAPGRLSSADLALYLSSSDLVLLPYCHGAITNKTTLMAALQLGRPVLSTCGPSTDDILLDPGLRLIAVDDPAGYAAAAVALMHDPAKRAALGQCGRALYERAFTWRKIAAQTMEALGISPPEASDC